MADSLKLVMRPHGWQVRWQKHALGEEEKSSPKDLASLRLRFNLSHRLARPRSAVKAWQLRTYVRLGDPRVGVDSGHSERLHPIIRHPFVHPSPLSGFMRPWPSLVGTMPESCEVGRPLCPEFASGSICRSVIGPGA